MNKRTYCNLILFLFFFVMMAQIQCFQNEFTANVMPNFAFHAMEASSFDIFTSGLLPCIIKIIISFIYLSIYRFNSVNQIFNSS